MDFETRGIVGKSGCRNYTVFVGKLVRLCRDGTVCFRYVSWKRHGQRV